MLLVFGVIIAGYLIIDLGFLSRKAKAISTIAAAWQSLFWVLISAVFGIFVYFEVGEEQAFEYYSAYITEYALSVDNIFVIILILRYFKVDEAYFHRVLFWGILGAMVMRAFFIYLGALLIEEFEWVLYIFGAFLLYTGGRMLFSKEDDAEDFNAEANPILRFARRILRFTPDFRGGKFYVRENGHLYFTPLFMVLILIEATDLIFAVDSIPAAFGITTDEFVIYTSNIFAVMGLRAMFFLLAGVLDKFYLLQRGLSLVLIFIGIKMLLGIFDVHLRTYISLSVISFLLGGSIIFSVLFPRKEQQAHLQTPPNA